MSSHEVEKKVLSIHGTTLHSGISTRVCFHLAPGPVRFRHRHQEIPLHLKHVVGTPRCTILGNGTVQVGVVEHLCAALYMAGWWEGLVIEVQHEELPILDGSAHAWLAALRGLGTPPPAPAALYLPAPETVQHADSTLYYRPASQFALCVEIDFPHPWIGQQRWCGTAATCHELAAARTFGFLHELDALHRQGLALGASLENVLAFDAHTALVPLRFPDEPVRHKALDVLGDLFLLGQPLLGQITVKRGSHSAHLALARRLAAAAARVSTAPVRPHQSPEHGQ